jgi:outer membrane lipoprotein-sorting protein
MVLPFLALALSPLRGQQAQETPLDPVLRRMDAAAADFHTTQADFEWDRYEKVIDEIDDVQTGTIYFRRSGKSDAEMKADIKMRGDSKNTLALAPQFVLFTNGKLEVFDPKTNQTNAYDSGKNRAEFESYLVLGFGGSGQDLRKSFDVKYLGPETVDNVKTAELELIPKSERVRNNFARILLWIDLDRGISVQQQLFDLQNDYRLAKYSAIRVNEKLPNGVFTLKSQ